MDISITILSIFAITLAVWLANRVLPYKVCPICAGVSGTWMLMLGARFLGYFVDPSLLALLLGASVAGVAYQLEKKLAQGRSELLFKALFILVGFIAAYEIVQNQWFLVIGVLVILSLLAYAFLRVPNPPAGGKKVSKRVESLEEKMKQCC